MNIRLSLQLILLYCFSSLGSVYILQYVYGIEPCHICLYERYPLMIAGLLAILGLISPHYKRLCLGTSALPLIVGTALGIYHVGVEQGFWLDTLLCHSDIFQGNLEDVRRALENTHYVPCNEVLWSLFGISLAGYNAIFTGAIAIFACIQTWRYK